MHLVVQNAFHYNGNFPSFRQPTEIGCFSLDGERQFHDDNHQLKYLVMPRSITGLHMDLNKGYSEAIKKDFQKKEKIDTMLRWILTHQERVKNVFMTHGTNTIKIDFVCFRGLLTEICSTTYENKEDWLICATKYKSVIFLCAFDTEQDVQRREKMTERDKLMSSWGYKFEQYMVSDSQNTKPNTSIPVNEKEEYCIMLKGRLNNHTLLYSAEVDGEDPSYFRHPGNDPNSTRCYMELKTSRIITNERQ
ncbi:Protein Dom3Z, partial [Stegodyphus mimosarum]